MVNNFERMIQLADQFFSAKNDPSQISVTEKDRIKLLQIHPSAMSQLENEEGPYAWLIIIPTTDQIMQKFISGEINEQELLDQTPVPAEYTAIYLCSILILPEFREKGAARKMSIDAIQSIRNEHPVTSVFYWAFSAEGDNLANSIARETGLALYKRIVRPA